MAKENTQKESDGIDSDVNKLFAGDSQDASASIVAQIGTGADELVRNAPKRTIILHNTGDVDGNKAAFFAVNGVGYMIPRETKVVVPLPIVEVIRNTVETHYYREEDERGPFGPIRSREIARYPLTILG
jgi:hypothetical protein